MSLHSISEGNSIDSHTSKEFQFDSSTTYNLYQPVLSTSDPLLDKFSPVPHYDNDNDNDDSSELVLDSLDNFDHSDDSDSSDISIQYTPDPVLGNLDTFDQSDHFDSSIQYISDSVLDSSDSSDSALDSCDSSLDSSDSVLDSSDNYARNDSDHSDNPHSEIHNDASDSNKHAHYGHDYGSDNYNDKCHYDPSEPISTSTSPESESSSDNIQSCLSNEARTIIRCQRSHLSTGAVDLITKLTPSLLIIKNLDRTQSPRSCLINRGTNLYRLFGINKCFQLSKSRDSDCELCHRWDFERCDETIIAQWLEDKYLTLSNHSDYIKSSTISSPAQHNDDYTEYTNLRRSPGGESYYPITSVIEQITPVPVNEKLITETVIYEIISKVLNLRLSNWCHRYRVLHSKERLPKDEQLLSECIHTLTYFIDIPPPIAYIIIIHFSRLVNRQLTTPTPGGRTKKNKRDSNRVDRLKLSLNVDADKSDRLSSDHLNNDHLDNGIAEESAVPHFSFSQLPQFLQLDQSISHSDEFAKLYYSHQNWPAAWFTCFYHLFSQLNQRTVRNLVRLMVATCYNVIVDNHTISRLDQLFTVDSSEKLEKVFRNTLYLLLTA